ncbi:ras-related protein Rab-34-like isoform X1 [Branchiostoma floridae]|uniref:Ras-related protein Rab-36 n=1 Tax=Branchiostoma floridae TaxID=7739 RepID=A0A9J7M0F1_BRAFL|nr:ras-related protein Rab-34-like isoform X1 [Branchiostoma floridae]
MTRPSRLRQKWPRGTGSFSPRQTDTLRRHQRRGRWFQPSPRRSCPSEEGVWCLAQSSHSSKSYTSHIFVFIQAQGLPTQPIIKPDPNSTKCPSPTLPGSFLQQQQQQQQPQQLVSLEFTPHSKCTSTPASLFPLHKSWHLLRTEVCRPGHEMSSSRSARTAGAKVIARHASKDRVINSYPLVLGTMRSVPYRQDSTPYLAFNFNPKVKAACSAQKAVTSSLRICKAIVIGDVAVGKTCLVNRFCKDTFDRDYKATIGVDFEVERFDILNTPFNLQVWDTAGQERFQCIAAAYYRGAHVIIVTFDLLDIKTLEHTQSWLEAAMLENTENHPLIFLVGTKKDLCSKAVYEKVEEDAVRTAKELGAEFWGVSSKTGEGVKDFFFRVAGLAFNEAVLKEVDVSSPSKQIVTSDLIKVDRNTKLPEHKKSRCGGKCST